MSQTLELKRNGVQLLLERLIYAIFCGRAALAVHTRNCRYNHLPPATVLLQYPTVRAHRHRLQYMYKIILYPTKACYRKPLCLRRSGAETRTKLCTLPGAFRAW